MTAGATARKTDAAPEAAAPPRAQHRRVSTPDLSELGNWLTERLKDVFPGLAPRNVQAWLAGCTVTNSFFFIRTAHAVALAQINHRPLDPTPFVEEIFTLAMDGFEDEAADLYLPMAEWAKGLGASELRLGGWDSDVHIERVIARIGTIRQKTYYVSKIT